LSFSNDTAINKKLKSFQCQQFTQCMTINLELYSPNSNPNPNLLPLNWKLARQLHLPYQYTIKSTR